MLGRTARFVAGIFFFSAIFSFSNGEWIFGLLILLLTAFAVFSYSGVEVDTEKKMLRQYNSLFGLVKTGKWKSAQSYLGVTLIPFSQKESIASWSNQTNTTKKTDYRIFMVNKARKHAFAIKCCKTPDEARDSLDEFSIWLKLPVFSVKR